MPIWVCKLIWRMRGKRRVAIHLERKVEGVDSMTIQGILIFKAAGHYVLELGKLLEPNADGSARTIPLDARYIEIPADRVLFLEVFAK